MVLTVERGKVIQFLRERRRCFRVRFLAALAFAAATAVSVAAFRAAKLFAFCCQALEFLVCVGAGRAEKKVELTPPIVAGPETRLRKRPGGGGDRNENLESGAAAASPLPPLLPLLPLVFLSLIPTYGPVFYCGNLPFALSCVCDCICVCVVLLLLLLLLLLQLLLLLLLLLLPLLFLPPQL